MKIVSVGEMRELDRVTIEKYVSGGVLMERAGEGLFRVITEVLEEMETDHSPVFFAGCGNNGGDAFVAARLLARKGIESAVYLVGDEKKLSPDAAEQYKKLRAVPCQVRILSSGKELEKIRISRETIVIDGLLGTGLKGPVRGNTGEVINFINSTGGYVIAIDIPSGLDGDTGKAAGLCIVADVTVTMGLPKRGLLCGDGLDYCGRVETVDIGIPGDLIDDVAAREFYLTEKDVPEIQPRPRISHKGDFGHVFIVGGSTGLTGAPVMAAMGALRSGAGLVTVGIPASLNTILETKLTEAMTIPLPDNNGFFSPEAAENLLVNLKDKSVLVLGPGLGRDDSLKTFITSLLPDISIPIVIDADALYFLSQEKDFLKSINTDIVLTPHPGEMARLTGKDSLYVQKNRWEITRSFAQDNNVIVVLKGAGSVIAVPDGDVFINSTGNPGMATGGMGDVLSGMIGAWIAQGLDPLTATKRAVFLHGLAGDLAVQETGERGLLPTDLLKYIGLDIV